MIPGLTTKLSEEVLASAATIHPKTDLIRVTGSTDIGNIIPTFGGGFSGILFVVPVDGAVSTVNTGNIAVAVAMAQNRVTMFTFSKATGKWYPGAIS